MKLYKGDCLEVLKDIPNNSIDLIVTDPPYKLVGGGDITQAAVPLAAITDIITTNCRRLKMESTM